MTILQQQLKQVFPTLPKEIKDLLLSEDFNDRIEKIAAAHKLNEYDAAVLVRLTVRLLSGITSPTTFVSGIVENIEVDHAKAVLIAQDLNRDIFNPVKDALKTLYGGKVENTQPESVESIKNNTSDVHIQPQTAPEKATIPPPTFSLANALGKDNGTTPSSAQTPVNTTPISKPKPQPADNMPKPHIGNIFEEKLGGAFRVKSDTVEYTTPKTTPPQIQTSQQNSTTQNQIPPTKTSTLIGASIPPAPTISTLNQPQTTARPMIHNSLPQNIGAVETAKTATPNQTIPATGSPIPPPPIAASPTPPSPIKPASVTPTPPPAQTTPTQKAPDPYRELPI